MNMLFVEDDELIRNNYREYLQKHFDTIYEASNGYEGLELFNKYSIDCILADIEMSRMNGITMIKKIREIDQHVPIIILTAYDTKEYLLHAIKLNLTEYLIKPIQYHTFVDTIKSLVLQLQKESTTIIELIEGFKWDFASKKLVIDSDEVVLTKNEQLFFETFCTTQKREFQIEEVSRVIYPLEEFNDNKVRMLFKRIRLKTCKEMIRNSYNLGFSFNYLESKK